MKSDALFYQLFQTAPQIFFELIATIPACPYQFKSITLKTAEKRLDGFLEPMQSGQPLYFVEVQAKKDEGIYWRILHEVALYFEQHPDQQSSPWSAVVMWLDKKSDPGLGFVPAITVADKTQRIISLKLPDALKNLPDTSLALNVLRPFIVDNETEVRQNFVMWVQHIHSNSPDPAAEQRLLEVLTQLIEQKFRTLTYKELAKMLNLVPLRELPSGQELIHEVLQDYSIDMLTKQIKQKFHFADKTLNRVMLRLRQLTLKDLEQLFGEILKFKSLKQLNAWIDQRLAAQQTTESPETPPAQ
jgi:predicted transposase YdaD